MKVESKVHDQVQLRIFDLNFLWVETSYWRFTFKIILLQPTHLWDGIFNEVDVDHNRVFAERKLSDWVQNFNLIYLHSFIKGFFYCRSRFFFDVILYSCCLTWRWQRNSWQISRHRIIRVVRTSVSNCRSNQHKKLVRCRWTMLVCHNIDEAIESKIWWRNKIVVDIALCCSDSSN